MNRDEKITKIQELVYEMKVEEVMRKKVVTVGPTTQMSELREILRANRISGVPVVDSEKLVGIISLEDFIKWLADREDDCPIEAKMTRDVSTLYADEPLVTAVNKLDQFGYGRFPVLDRETNGLVGIITSGLVVEGLLRKLEIDYSEEEIHRYRASHIFEDILADRTRLLFEYDVVGQDFQRAGGSASGLKTTLRRLGIDPRIVRRVAIATYEAEMNVVVYTPGGRISCQIDPEKILVDVRDSGPGIPDIEKAMEPGFSTAPDWVRELGFGAGMGLVNIKKCADEMVLTSDVGKGTHLRVRIYTKHGRRS